MAAACARCVLSRKTRRFPLSPSFFTPSAEFCSKGQAPSGHRACSARFSSGSTSAGFPHAQPVINHAERLSEFTRRPEAVDHSECIGQPTAETHPHLMSRGEVTPGITREEFRERRGTLMRNLGNSLMGRKHKKHLVIVTSNADKFMTIDVPYPFRQNSDFLYLTGFQEPDSVLVLESLDGTTAANHRSILFVRPRDPKKELWEGPRAGIAGAVGHVGVDEAFSIDDLRRVLLERYSNKDYFVWYNQSTPSHPGIHRELSSILYSSEKFSCEGVSSPSIHIENLRAIKSPDEIQLLRKSASIAAKSLIKVMRHTSPGLQESHLQAIMEYECRISGAERLAYPPVVAGGVMANTLHYISNNQMLSDGEVILMDTGCEYHGYASDITRIWPVNGKFTQPQRLLYDAVLRVQKQCISMCRKGVTLDNLHMKMLQLLGYELEGLGICPPCNSENELRRAGSQFCPHHLGHYLGMDTHDTSLLHRSIPLQPGMVVTIEPGVYIRPGTAGVPKQYQGIGIRIEDDILITDGEPENLSEECPKEVEDIERISNSRQNSHSSMLYG